MVRVVVLEVRPARSGEMRASLLMMGRPRLSGLTTLTGCWTGWSGWTGWTAKLDRRAVAFRTAEGQRPPSRDVETLRQPLPGSSLRTVG